MFAYLAIFDHRSAVGADTFEARCNGAAHSCREGRNESGSVPDPMGGDQRRTPSEPVAIIAMFMMSSSLSTGLATACELRRMDTIEWDVSNAAHRDG